MPHIITDFPRAVRAIEHTWIPLSDGTRLAARIWLPEDAETDPVPAILEYIPYRKRDFTRGRDTPMHPYVAGHGYATVRVDLRGAGDSEGLLHDEYLDQEQRDAVEVIDWLATQPWCTSAVGMMGISWGGFNALQVAARRPKALRAIITLCAADDRYADDAHYMGGGLLNENQIWGSVFMLFNALPPDPEIVGERWRTMWMERLKNARCFPDVWLRHPHRDVYWKQGSVCEDYDAIQCPVYAIGGWADGYSNAIPRLLDGLSAPRKGLIGPWSHAFPHNSAPGPTIGFLQEALRWWDHWLKGKDTGVMDEPMLRAWMQDSVPPQAFYDERPGRWVAEPEWPSPSIEKRTWHLNADGLGDAPGAEGQLTIRSPQTTGLAGGDWCGFGADGELPTDQREDDGRSLTFDSAPLKEPLEILGAPVVTLTLSADRPVAQVAVRLCDVAPDGASTRVTYGLLNLTHRASHEHPEPLTPGEPIRVSVQLNDIAHAFPEGHRLRVAVSTSYWPITWPAPEAVTLILHAGLSRLTLPIRSPQPEDEALRPFPPPETAPPIEHSLLRPGRHFRTVERDLTTDETVYTVFSEGDEFDGAVTHIEEINLDVGYAIRRQFRIRPEDPCSARTLIDQRALLRRDDWQVHVNVRTQLSCTENAFHVQATLEAYEGDACNFTERWDRFIERDLV